jgi:DNA-binding NtrC family response regulator
MTRHQIVLYDIEGDACTQHNPREVLKVLRTFRFPREADIVIQRELLACNATPDLILLPSPTEHQLGNTVDTLRGIWGKTPILGLICPTNDLTDELEQALSSKLDDYLLCPFNEIDFAPRIRRLLSRKPDHPKGCSLASKSSNGPSDGVLIGKSSNLTLIRSKIEKVSQSDCSVLITGETGTGKELVARTIHERSARSHHPFISINCAAIPDTLIESELFGFERGAFTGATHSHPGQLQLADSGTVLLDEIGDMSLVAQAKLLRVLEQRSIRHLAGRTNIPIDIRVISATNQDLNQLIKNNQFRKDLFYRLNVTQLHIPPLRDHREDIPELTQHMLTQLCRRGEHLIPTLTPQALHCLQQHSWPGNVRELRNVLESSLLSIDKDSIDLKNFPLSLTDNPAAHGGLTLDERERLKLTLSLTKWNKSQAAKQLDWSRMTLYRKLQKYKIDLGNSDL